MLAHVYFGSRSAKIIYAKQYESEQDLHSRAMDYLVANLPARQTGRIEIVKFEEESHHGI